MYCWARVLCEELRDVRLWQECLALYGNALLLGGDLHGAIAMWQELVESAQRTDNDQGSAWGSMGAAHAHVALGQHEQANTLYERSRAYVERSGDSAASISAAASSMAHWWRGDKSRARTVAEHTLALTERS